MDGWWIMNERARKHEINERHKNKKASIVKVSYGRSFMISRYNNNNKNNIL